MVKHDQQDSIQIQLTNSSL